MRRDDLRVNFFARIEGSSSLFPTSRPITDDEFDRVVRAEGYVKLDGIDVEQVRAAVTQEGWNDGLRLGVLVPFARQVLAALNETATP